MTQIECVPPGPLEELLAPEKLPLPEPEDEELDDIDEPLDLLPEPDEEPLLLEEPLPELEPEPVVEPEAETPLELTTEVAGAVSPGMSLWTHTPSAEKVFVPGM